MVVPGKPIVYHPSAVLRKSGSRQVMLQSGREIIRITVMMLCIQPTHGSLVGSPPEVEVLRHINLLEDIHESLLLRRLVDLVIETHRENVCTLTVVDVMTAEQCNDRTFRDHDHVPAGRELHETWRDSMVLRKYADRGQCVPAIPKNTLARPKPPLPRLPSSSILRTELICLPL